MQVLLGLQSNALKFTVKGQVTIIVRIIEDKNSFGEKLVEISVKDTGVGISKENQKKLFRLFGFI